ncbi:MAG: DUF4167 domain-containing protein [Parvibaculum sp.]|uniref:DUF4167 domain-containing protein n=1 Tax=Parvibaculum sp. TaxID=2024848 RepID=UPI0025DB0B00|nr:DUF4167 domain-containing protein [Parvibaculum sp.]MCE9651334.1 DUF4167 domain-containing protein [Parvibaculum sp.]
MNHIRQGQNNNNSKRSRGRGRKPQNSGNRAYDSNGPDVKIRGTATHVCEKYQQLARDAITSGDRVMAENYYQHAEHYYRLIMASQTPNDGQPRPQNALGYRPDEDQEEDEEDFGGDQPQPNFPNQPYHQQQPNYDRQQRHNNNNGNGGRNPYQQDRNQDRAPAPAPTEGAAESSAVAADGGEQPVVGDGQNAQGAAPEGGRRRQGRRRRQRHDAGGVNAGDEGGDAGGEAPSASGGSDEVPVA